MSKYIGIDQSITGTAVCVLEGTSKAEILHLETISTTPKIPHLKRLKYIVDSVEDILKPHRDANIAIEGYSFGSKGRAVFDLAELGGLLRMLLAVHFNGYYDVPPTSLKKFITGKGNAPKNIMLERVFRKYGIGSEILTDDNKTDAFSLAQYIRCNHKTMEKITL